jgi:hypothetical protein
VSASVRPTTALLIAGTLLLLTSACGSDNPKGTISKDDLPGSVTVAKVRHDDQAGQVTCQAVNDAEDNHVMTPSPNYDQDKRAAVAYELKGADHQEVSNSVWRLSRPTEALAQVTAGLAVCSKADPSAYKQFQVPGHPAALGYIAMEGTPTPTYTRRILVPLSDRVVIVSSTRQGGSDFKVAPEDVLKKAIAVSEDAPKA